MSSITPRCGKSGQSSIWRHGSLPVRIDMERNAEVVAGIFTHWRRLTLRPNFCKSLLDDLPGLQESGWNVARPDDRTGLNALESFQAGQVSWLGQENY